MARMTGAKYMVETMKEYGVTHVFYMPMIVTKALVEMEKVGIGRIMAHSEKAAAYMADGYARAAHGPGICMAQNVGAANLAAGLQDPYLACSPVIALTGRAASMNQYRNHYQEVDHIQPFNAVTKYNAMVDSTEQLPLLLRQAFRTATSGSPGPVHLDLQSSNGSAIMDVEADLDVIVEPQFARVPPFRGEPEIAMVRDAARVLTSARRPIIVAGGGVASSGAQQEVVELADMLSIPVATSLNAKGTIPDDHPLSVGVCGTYSRRCANQAVSEADLVFFIGSHTGSQVTTEWKIPAQGTRVIQLDIDPYELGRSYPIEVGLQGDAKASLRKLIEVLEPMGGREDWVAHCQEFVRSWRESVADKVNSDASPGMWLSRKEGKAQLKIESKPTIAEGLEGGVSEVSYRLGLEYIDDVVLAKEADLRKTVPAIARKEKMVVEGSAAAGVAALLDGQVTGKKIVVVLTCSNIDPARFSTLLQES